MSDTPQTDERTYSADCLGKTLVVNADWAKLLERENAALRHSEENMAATVRGLEFELEKAQTENATLREALDAQMQYQRELRADRDRLDYMEECSVDIELGLDETGAMKVAHIYIDRAAIDAARSKEGGAT